MDSTGINSLGDGEWLARKHGTHRRRHHRKVHLAAGAPTRDIRAMRFASSRESAGAVLPEILDQIRIGEDISTVSGDGASDTRRCHSAILAWGRTGGITNRKDGRFWKQDCPTALAWNDILRSSLRLGRTIWKRWSGFHVRGRVDTRMRNLKSFGERIASTEPNRQTAEMHIRVAPMNRFTALGAAEVECLAGT